MKKLLLLALLLLLSNFGQTQTTGPGFVIYVGSAPSGTCSSGAYQEDVIGLGTVYTCQSGTWTQISGGGGGSGTVTSVICGTNLDGGTITTTGTCSVKASPAFTGVPTSPTAAQGTNTTQLATMAALQTAIQGVNPAVAVQAATTAVLPNSPTYSNGASGIGATLTAGSAAALVVDGYTPVLNDRILVKTQASSFQNGVYFLSTLGTGIIPYVLTRALDFDMPSDMNNTGAIPVLNGTVNAITQWVISSSVTTVGTDAVTFTQFSSNPANNVSDGLSFGTLAIGAVASGASIATNSITVATTGVVYVFCGSWGSGTATLTLTDTLTSTVTSIGDTGDNTTSFNSRMHAWKVVPASNGSDAFTCAGAAAGSHVDVAALYYPTAGNKTVDVNVFGNVNADQTGKNLSITPTGTDRIILALFSVNGATDRFSGFSGFNFPLVQNQATSGNSFFVWERPNFPTGTFSPTAYGISNQPMHMAILGVN